VTIEISGLDGDCKFERSAVPGAGVGGGGPGGGESGGDGTKEQAKAGRHCSQATHLHSGGLVDLHVPFQGSERNRSACRERLPDLAFLPEFELPEKLIFLLLAHRLSAGGLLTLVDKLREDRLEILEIWCGGYLHVAF